MNSEDLAKEGSQPEGAGHDEDHHDTTPSPYGATPPPDPGAGREN
jgi:hypothetical protein